MEATTDLMNPSANHVQQSKHFTLPGSSLVMVFVATTEMTMLMQK
jgi:hypothetical protein